MFVYNFMSEPKNVYESKQNMEEETTASSCCSSFGPGVILHQTTKETVEEKKYISELIPGNKPALASAASISAHRVVCNHQRFVRLHFKWADIESNLHNNITVSICFLILIKKHAQPSRIICSELSLRAMGLNAYNMMMQLSPPAICSDHTPLTTFLENAAALRIPLTLQLLPLAIT